VQLAAAEKSSWIFFISTQTYSDIIPEIVVTPPSKKSDTLLCKDWDVRIRIFLKRTSLVTQDKDKERRALVFFSCTGSVTKVLKREEFYVKNPEINSRYDADL